MRKSVANTKIVLGPAVIAEIQLVFWPSSMTETRETTVSITSAAAGNTYYQVKGVGLQPDLMDATEVFSQIRHPISSTIVFTNPFIDPISVSVSLAQEEGKKDFGLMLNRKGRFNISGLEKLDIPFTFNPAVMRKSSAEIIVEMNPQLQWSFPIKVGIYLILVGVLLIFLN